MRGEEEVMNEEDRRRAMRPEAVAEERRKRSVRNAN
jgi:hypothetical protein